MSRNSHFKHEHKKHIKHTTQTLHENYKTGLIGDIIIIILIVGLGLFFILPFYNLLSNMVQMMIMLIFLLIVTIFAGLIWKSRPKDERELQHHAQVGSVVYSIAILLIGLVILIQALQHKLDVWLVVILLCLVVIRIVYLSYLKMS